MSFICDSPHKHTLFTFSSHLYVSHLYFLCKVMRGATAIETSASSKKNIPVQVSNQGGLVKPLQDALTGLVGFVCGIQLTKWTDAKNVTSTPQKLQQHVMIE